MATGISAHEQHSEDALTAQVPHRDTHPLPDCSEPPRLVYPNKLPEADVLAPIGVDFCKPAAGAWEPCPLEPNALVLCDNLAGLNALAHSGQKATLIYMDPPYNTGMDFHSRGLQHAYKDDRSTAAYVEFMRRRLILARECLADDGSIYVHIGHQMLAHLKVVLDEVFGASNFRNVISRRKCSSKNFTSKQYANIQDYILFYSKTARYRWNRPATKPSAEWIAREYPKVDERGQYKLVPVHAPGTRRGETGQPWRGVNPPPGKHWQYAPSKLEELDRIGHIHWSKTGNPRRKVYLTDDKSVPLTDNWDGFRDAHHQSIKITGYPTEKNFEMLKMIVEASSDPGDLVLDPFCGSGTTLHAANELGRRWIGLDESFVAVETATRRMRHGLQPMGDYVDRSSGAKGERMQGLFDNLVDVPKVTPLRRPVGADFSLLVDGELVEPYREQIDYISNV